MWDYDHHCKPDIGGTHMIRIHQMQAWLTVGTQEPGLTMTQITPSGDFVLSPDDVRAIWGARHYLIKALPGKNDLSDIYDEAK